MNFELLSLTFEMYLSRPAEYALRVMTYIARQVPTQRILTRDLCPLHTEWSVLKGQIEQWARKHTLNDTLKKSRVS
jgi:DNA-binding IscR family transcriptional regulator